MKTDGNSGAQFEGYTFLKKICHVQLAYHVISSQPCYELCAVKKKGKKTSVRV
jgi:hypothetical protein